MTHILPLPTGQAPTTASHLGRPSEDQVMTLSSISLLHRHLAPVIGDDFCPVGERLPLAFGKSSQDPHLLQLVRKSPFGDSAISDTEAETNLPDQ